MPGAPQAHTKPPLPVALSQNAVKESLCGTLALRGRGSPPHPPLPGGLRVPVRKKPLLTPEASGFDPALSCSWWKPQDQTQPSGSWASPPPPKGHVGDRVPHLLQAPGAGWVLTARHLQAQPTPHPGGRAALPATWGHQPSTRASAPALPAAPWLPRGTVALSSNAQAPASCAPAAISLPPAFDLGTAAEGAGTKQYRNVPRAQSSRQWKSQTRWRVGRDGGGGAGTDQRPLSWLPAARHRL